MKLVKIKINAARVKLMWHGTSSTFLRSILKKGLGFGKEKVWNQDKGKLESLGGVYLTNNFGTASASAWDAKHKFGGNKLFIGALISLDQNTSIDEDSLGAALGLGLKAVGWMNHFWSDMGRLDNPDNSKWGLNLNDGFEKFKSVLLKNMDDRHIKRASIVIDKNKKLIMQTLKSYYISEILELVEREKGYYEKQWYKDGANTPPDWLFDYDKRVLKVSWKDYLNHIHKPNLKKLTDAVGILMRGYKEENLGNFPNNNVRVSNVGYKGSRRIVLIIEEVEPKSFSEDSNKKLILHYIKDKNALNTFIERYEMSQGRKYNLVDKKGKYI